MAEDRNVGLDGRDGGLAKRMINIICGFPDAKN